MEYQLHYLNEGYISNGLVRNLLVTLDKMKLMSYIENMSMLSYYSYKIENYNYRQYDQELMQIQRSCNRWVKPIDIDDKFSYTIEQEDLKALNAVEEDILDIDNVSLIKEYATVDNLIFRLCYKYNSNRYTCHVYRVLDQLDDNYTQYIAGDMMLLHSLY